MGVVLLLGFTVLEGATRLTAEAAAATLLARLNLGFLEVSWPTRLGVAEVAELFVVLGRIGSKGERLGL